MSFTGSLAHLPIPDVIQLLESTKKTGTLTVKNNQIEYRFGLADGLIISVSHPDTGSSLAKIMKVEQIIDENIIDDALKIHKDTNKPLLSVLFEKNQISREQSLKVLSSLVIMTVVDILKWNEGSFELDVTKQDISDEFKTLNEIKGQHIYISTQNILMEALRIYDELRRDQKLNNEIFEHETFIQTDSSGEIVISEDILGLDNIDKLEIKIPDVFSGIKVIDIREIHRKKIKEYYPEISTRDLDALVDYIISIEEKKNILTAQFSLIFYSKDGLSSYLINVIGSSLGYLVFTTDAEENLPIILNQSINKNLFPVVIIDSSSEDKNGFSPDALKRLKKQLKLNYSDISVINIVKINEPLKILENIKNEDLFSIPKPDLKQENVGETILFCNGLRSYLRKIIANENRIIKLVEILPVFKEVDKISDILDTVYGYLSSYFKRQILFLVRKDELIAEKTVGINNITTPLIFSIRAGSLIFNLLQSGKIFFGESPEDFKKDMAKIIEIPDDSKILLLPFKGLDKTLALVYADSCYEQFSLMSIKIIQGLGNLTMSSLLYRKMFEKIKTQ